MKTLSQRAAALVQQLETRGTTIDMAGIEALLRDVAAARDLEPVAEITDRGTLKLLNVSALDYGVKFYTSPPSPSVPDMRLTGQWESSRIADYNRGWNECRQAMLSAAPTPAEAPDQSEQRLGMVPADVAKDAARYRYLRDSVGDAWDDAIGTLTGIESPELINAAIDAAMEIEKGGAT